MGKNKLLLLMFVLLFIPISLSDVIEVNCGEIYYVSSNNTYLVFDDYCYGGDYNSIVFNFNGGFIENVVIDINGKNVPINLILQGGVIADKIIIMNGSFANEYLTVLEGEAARFYNITFINVSVNVLGNFEYHSCKRSCFLNFINSSVSGNGVENFGFIRIYSYNSYLNLGYVMDEVGSYIYAENTTGSGSGYECDIYNSPSFGGCYKYIEYEDLVVKTKQKNGLGIVSRVEVYDNGDVGGILLNPFSRYYTSTDEEGYVKIKVPRKIGYRIGDYSGERVIDRYYVAAKTSSQSKSSYVYFSSPAEIEFEFENEGVATTTTATITTTITTTTIGILNGVPLTYRGVFGLISLIVLMGGVIFTYRVFVLENDKHITVDKIIMSVVAVILIVVVIAWLIGIIGV